MMIKSVAPAHPQNNSDVPPLIPYDMNVQKKLNVIIAIRPNPMMSKIFVILLYLLFRKIKKIYGFVN